MKALVIYDTLFGNTQKIASSLVAGLRRTGVHADQVNANAVDFNGLAEYDLIVIGAPTQYFTASKPMKLCLEGLRNIDLRGKAGFAFDTKLDSRVSGSAAKYIEKRLAESGIIIIKPRQSAIVTGRKERGGAKTGDSVLRAGMETEFQNLGHELGTLLRSKMGMAETS